MKYSSDTQGKGSAAAEEESASDGAKPSPHQQLGQQADEGTTTTTTTSGSTGGRTAGGDGVGGGVGGPSSPGGPLAPEGLGLQRQNQHPRLHGSYTRPHRDSSWLEVEVCKNFVQQRSCPRSQEQCRFAHPDPNVQLKENKVTCCYDFLKDRCSREVCRYFHPPQHIKERLVNAGKQFGLMMNTSPPHSGPPGPPSPLYVMQPSGMPSPIASSTHGVPLMSEMYQQAFSPIGAPPPSPFTPRLPHLPYTDAGFVPMANGGISPAVTTSTVMSPYGVTLIVDRFLVCPDFLRGHCANGPVCPLAHPEPSHRINPDCTVTVCKDFVRGDCQRDHCRYFHHVIPVDAAFFPGASPMHVPMPAAALPSPGAGGAMSPFFYPAPAPPPSTAAPLPLPPFAPPPLPPPSPHHSSTGTATSPTGVVMATGTPGSLSNSGSSCSTSPVPVSAVHPVMPLPSLPAIYPVQFQGPIMPISISGDYAVATAPFSPVQEISISPAHRVSPPIVQ